MNEQIIPLTIDTTYSNIAKHNIEAVNAIIHLCSILFCIPSGVESSNSFISSAVTYAATCWYKYVVYGAITKNAMEAHTVFKIVDGIKN